MNRTLSVLAFAALFTTLSAEASTLDCLLTRSCVETEKVLTHMKALQDIANVSNGHRSAGSKGYDLSANYVAQQFTLANFEVKLQPFEFIKFKKTAAEFKVNGKVFKDMTDYKVMNFSVAGSATGTLVAVDVQLGAGNATTSGCEDADYSNFPKGAIAVVQRGGCLFTPKVMLAQKAGASGIIVFNQGNTPERMELMEGNLDQDNTTTIQSITIGHDLGVELVKAAGTIASISTVSTTEKKVTNNIIAESKTGNADSVVVIGGHLDSVDEGPGINDNASGVAALIEVAKNLSAKNLNNKIRFAIFSAEEIGMVGSAKYVESLSETEIKKIALYLNVDMIASPNYMLSTYDGDGSRFGNKGPTGSGAIEAKFHEVFKAMGIKSTEAELNGRSDYAAFADAGIAVGGLDTGADELKSEEQALLFGGKAGEAFDSCYHKACDDMNNLSLEALEVNSNVLMAVMSSFADSVEAVRSEK